jgi:hypothetical protein
MHLEQKPDFEQTLARFEAWWVQEIVDRPPVCIRVAPDRPPTPPQKTHAALRDRWMDVEFALDCFEAELAGATFVGDAFPAFFPNLGPEICSTVFGCDLDFSETTSWSKPIVRRCRDILSLRPNLDNPFWNAVRRGIDLSLERGAGRWITGLTDLHTNGDLVASLRDPQGLCLDLADDPASVRAACDHVTRSAYALMYEDQWSRIRAAGQPATTWMPILHAGRAYPTNCDFICMISPAMFQDTILPSLLWEMRYLERNIFHLDGPGALQHLDALLALPELNGIQWVYGANRGPAARWTHVYRRIQAAGKSLQLAAEDLDDALDVARALRPEGVWFLVAGAYPRDTALAFLHTIERWTAGKKV